MPSFEPELSLSGKEKRMNPIYLFIKLKKIAYLEAYFITYIMGECSKNDTELNVLQHKSILLISVHTQTLDTILKLS